VQALKRAFGAGLRDAPLVVKLLYIVGVGVLVLGEVAALNGLYEEKATPTRTDVIIVSLIGTAILLAFSVTRDLEFGAIGRFGEGQFGKDVSALVVVAGVIAALVVAILVLDLG
jgi:hypothetical protein